MSEPEANGPEEHDSAERPIAMRPRWYHREAQRQEITLLNAFLRMLGVATALFGMLLAPQTLAQRFSPDGKALVFAAEDGLGLFDWKTGAVEKIPLPERLPAWDVFAYSTNGKKVGLTFRTSASEGGVALFDLSARRLERLAIPPDHIWRGIAFRPDDKAILYLGRHGRMTQECLYELTTGQRGCIPHLEQGYSGTDGFNSISNEYFVNDDTIEFVGLGVEIPTLKTQVESLGFRSTSSHIPYRMTIGSMPEIVHVDILKRHLALNAGVPSAPTQYLASRQGGRIVFIGRSSSEEERVARENGGFYRYDLFVIDSGKIRQVTRLETYLPGPLAISPDGSTAAVGVTAVPVSQLQYGARADRPANLVIVDLDTGKLTPTDFLSRQRNDPRFTAPK